MGWQDAPIIGDDDTPEWMSAPESKEGGHGPIGRRPLPDPLAKYDGMSALDKAKNDLGMVTDSLAGLRDSFNRMSTRVLTGGPTMVSDAWQTAENLAKNDDWSWSEALDNPFNPTPHPNWQPLPSDYIERLMDKYVAPPPQTAAGRLAELGGAALLSHRLPQLYTPPKVPTAPNPKLAMPGSDEIVNLGKKHHVRVFYDDITKNPILKKIGIFAESIPGQLGTSVGRMAQNEDALEAAKRTVGQQLPAAGDDVPMLMQQAMKRKLDVLKDQKVKLYAAAAQELDPHGIIPTPRLNQAFAESRNELSQLPMRANKKVLRTIKELSQQGGLHNFSVTSKLSDKLGSMIDDFDTGADATLGSEGVQYLQRMKKGLDSDIASFAQDVQKVGPTGRHAYKVADDFYKTHLVPYGAEGFNSLIKTTEPEKAWQYLTAQGGVPTRVTRMYNALDHEGRQSVRYGLVKTAFDDALDAKGKFSPAKFASYLENHDKVIKKFFKGDDLAEINGFRNLMRHVERSGQFMENPANGQRILLPALVGSGLYSMKIPVMGLTAGVGARVLFQTEKGRDLLRSLARSAPDSDAYKKSISNTMQFLATANALDRQSNAPTALDFNDVIENAVGPGPGDRQ